MTCPKCRSHHAKPIERWTLVGRKMTIPLVRLWACVNQDCRHQWPRDVTSPIGTLASSSGPELQVQNDTPSAPQMSLTPQTKPVDTPPQAA